MLDYLQANRSLQRGAITPSPAPATNTNFLNVAVPASPLQLENDLWEFLRRHWTVCLGSPAIQKAFVLTTPSVDVGRAFELICSGYATLAINSPLEADSVVMVLVRQLLQRHDYENAVRILDDTLNSENTRQRRRHVYDAVVRGCSLTAGAIGLALFAAAPLVLFPVVLPVATLLVYGLMWGLLRVHCGDAGMRVQWRPHTRLRHRFVHLAEQRVLNGMVEKFEETSEVNFTNFHLSKVRHMPDNTVSDPAGYEIYAPTAHTLPVTLEHVTDHVNDPISASTVAYLRALLGARKLVWSDLAHERRLIDFWRSHGDGFCWVEPDQDPAEMATFRREPTTASSSPGH